VFASTVRGTARRGRSYREHAVELAACGGSGSSPPRADLLRSEFIKTRRRYLTFSLVVLRRTCDER
jgi:hypothetical protein